MGYVIFMIGRSAHVMRTGIRVGFAIGIGVGVGVRVGIGVGVGIFPIDGCAHLAHIYIGVSLGIGIGVNCWGRHLHWCWC